MQIRRSIGAGLVALALTTAAGCGASGKSATTTTTATTASSQATTTTGGETTTTAGDTTTTSGGSAIPVKEWADGFCIPLGVWIKDLKAASAKVKTAPQTTIAEKKTAIEGLFDEAAAASEKLAGVIEALPPADMKQGDQIGPDLVTKFNDFTTESKATKDKVAAASDTDQVAFKAAATDAINAFQANVKVISDSFSALDTKYPDAAFQTAFKASCAGPLSGA